MKRTSLFNKTLLGAAMVALTLGSCKNEPKAEDPKEVAEDANEENLDTEATDSLEDDSQFLVDAAEVDMKEIELGKLAQTKSANADVKALGKMMVDAHTKASADTKKLADSKGITLPAAITDKGQDAYKDLNDKTGVDFDKAYADAMVDGHEKTIKKIEKASEKAKDPDVRMWAANMLPELRKHLEHSKMVKEKTDAVK
jgi:putative membrane protein